MKRVIVLVSVGALLACSSCIGQDETGESGPLALYKGDWSEDQALTEGLVVRDGPCLYLVNDGGLLFSGKALLAFAEGGARWDEEKQAIVADGRRIPVGTTLRLGGGETQGRDGRWVVPPKPSCDVSSVWISGPPQNYKIGMPIANAPTPIR